MPTATAASRWSARWRSKGCAVRHHLNQHWLHVVATLHEEWHADRDLVRLARIDHCNRLERRVTPEDQFGPARFRAAGTHRGSKAAAGRDRQGTWLAPAVAGDLRRAASTTGGSFARA